LGLSVQSIESTVTAARATDDSSGSAATLTSGFDIVSSDRPAQYDAEKGMAPPYDAERGMAPPYSRVKPQPF